MAVVRWRRSPVLELEDGVTRGFPHQQGPQGKEATDELSLGHTDFEKLEGLSG